MSYLGNVFINSGGNDNLRCLDVKATQKDFLALKFKLTSTL